MNIFEQHGIKEVADICLYSIELDENDDEVYIPVLYLDTLKVSTVEETAEQTSARGGLGNSELIIWDYGKEITVTLEDALYSPASMGMTWGGKYGTKTLELYGTIQTSVDGEVKGFNGKLIIENFSNFTRVNNNTWVWRSNVKAISNNGLERYRGEDINIGYNLSTKEYGGITGTHDGNITSGSNSPIILNTINQNDGKQKTVIFNIDKEKNKNAVSPQEVIYQIDHALKNVKYLERIEKCKATQTFVINTDVNTTHGNYRYLQKYSEKELTVFIDPKTMQPLARQNDENPDIVEQFQVVVNGWEIIKAYSELIDPMVQKANFDAQAKAREM